MRKVKEFIRTKLDRAVIALRGAVEDKKAEGYVDTGVKILIAVVIGALLLGGLYALFNSTVMPTVSEKITDLFSYNG